MAPSFLRQLIAANPSTSTSSAAASASASSSSASTASTATTLDVSLGPILQERSDSSSTVASSSDGVSAAVLPTLTAFTSASSSSLATPSSSVASANASLLLGDTTSPLKPWSKLPSFVAATSHPSLVKPPTFRSVSMSKLPGATAAAAAGGSGPPQLGRRDSLTSVPFAIPLVPVTSIVATKANVTTSQQVEAEQSHQEEALSSPLTNTKVMDPAKEIKLVRVEELASLQRGNQEEVAKETSKQTKQLARHVLGDFLAKQQQQPGSMGPAVDNQKDHETTRNTVEQPGMPASTPAAAENPEHQSPDKQLQQQNRPHKHAAAANALESLLTKRIGTGTAVDSEVASNATSPSSSSSVSSGSYSPASSPVAPDNHEAPHNALNAMLRARTTTSESHEPPGETHNALNAMLQARAATSENHEPRQNPHNALNAMLQARTATQESHEPRQKPHNALEAMLQARTVTSSSHETPSKPHNALNAMLQAKAGGAQTKEPPKAHNALNAMLQARAGTSAPHEAPAKPQSALEAMLQARQPPVKNDASKPQNALNAMLQARNASMNLTKSPRQESVSNPEPSIASQQEPVASSLAIKHDPKFMKYVRMLKIGLSKEQVAHKMQSEQVDPAALDMDLDRPYLVQKQEQEAAEKAKYAKYFQMLKVGLPESVVEHKMRLDGLDPRVVLGSKVSGPADRTRSGKHSGSSPSRKKPTCLRKKLHWEIVPHSRKSHTHSATNSGSGSGHGSKTSSSSRRDSLWHMVHMEKKYRNMLISRESQELMEELFVKPLPNESTNSGNGSRKGSVGGSKKHGSACSKDKKRGRTPKLAIHLIDMKKSQNIAITLARVKLSFPELKKELLAMNPTVLTTAQLNALIDMWPDEKEQETIENYHGEVENLGNAEKFLIETRNVLRFKEKLACLVFKQEFPTRVHELRESINLVIRSVNQVCSSRLLQEMFVYILQVGNLLNFGQDTQLAAQIRGFSLCSLVKLSQTKAFVGGTTFLQYIVQSVERDAPDLGHFHEEINLVTKASKVSTNMLVSEKTALENGLKKLLIEAKAVPSCAVDKDQEVATCILEHFATEVERELEDVQGLLDKMNQSKKRFLEYFEEKEECEVDELLGHLANFSEEYRREQKKAAANKRRPRPKSCSALRSSMSIPVSASKAEATGSTQQDPVSHRSGPRSRRNDTTSNSRVRSFTESTIADLEEQLAELDGMTSATFA